MKYKVYQYYHSCIKVEVEAKDKEEAEDLADDLISIMPDEEYYKQLEVNSEYDSTESCPEEELPV